MTIELKGLAGAPSHYAQGRPTVKLSVLVIAIQLFLAVAIYWQTHSFDFVYFDDAEYLVYNKPVHEGLTWTGVQWAFQSIYMSNWHPLTWLSHMLDVDIAGLDPGWPHLHNALLHLINSLLVYWLLVRLTGRGWPAAFCSVIFLVHPLHVESVAWIAERKDLLSALFFLGGLLLYDSYRAKPGMGRYLLVALFQSLALSAKSMAVTFPVVLLLLDAFHYNRPIAGISGRSKVALIARSVYEKIPLLLLSLAAGVTAIYTQQSGGAVASLDFISLSNRLAVATSAYGTYLYQFIAPVDLTAFYPLEAEFLSPLKLVGSVVALGTLGLIGWTLAGRKPLVAAGLVWFIVTLLPVIGLLKVGEQAHADRYMYLPSFGLLLAICVIFPLRNASSFRTSVLAGILIAATMSALSFWQVGVWENRNTLFTQVLQVHGPSYRAHFMLAQGYLDRNAWDQAEKHAKAALAINPRRHYAYKALGDVALGRGQYSEAEHQYRLATKYKTPSPETLNNLGVAIAEQGRRSLAIQMFKAALLEAPDFAPAQTNLQLYSSQTETDSQ